MVNLAAAGLGRPASSTGLRRDVVIAVGAGAAVAAVRLLSVAGFPNDHFFYLSRGSQMLAGALPVRDFVDPGFPLAAAASALAQVIGGPTLLSEAVLVALGFGAGAAFTAVAIMRWLGSMPAALAAVSVQLAVMPRSYSYPKILMYAAAAAAFVAYTAHPSRRRLGLMAVVIAVAFLFRHDHGLYIGIAAAVVTLLSRWRESPPRAIGDLLLLTMMAGALVAPYIVYVQLNGGVAAYLAEGFHFSTREAERTWTLLPRLPEGTSLGSAEALSTFGYYLFWMIPAAAALLLAARPSCRGPVIAGVLTMAAAANSGFLRDPLAGRLPDAVVPVTLVAAWLTIHLGGGERRPLTVWARRAVAVLIAAAALAASVEIGNFAEVVRRTGIPRGVPAAVARWRSVTAELRAPYDEHQMPTDLAYALVPFYEHVQQCTTPSARILVTGFAPEIAFYARRGFAGGHPSLYRGYWSTDDAQQRVIARLQRETVPYVVHSPEGVEQFADSFPLVQAYVSERYVTLADFRVDGFDHPARVLVHRGLTGGGPPDPQRWPCMPGRG